MADARTAALLGLLEQVRTEVRRAIDLHPPINSPHEGYAVILEELDEFWEEVRKRAEHRNAHLMRSELIQIAAMAIRTALDCPPTERQRQDTIDRFASTVPAPESSRSILRVPVSPMFGALARTARRLTFWAERREWKYGTTRDWRECRNPSCEVVGFKGPTACGRCGTPGVVSLRRRIRQAVFR